MGEILQYYRHWKNTFHKELQSLLSIEFKCLKEYSEIFVVVLIWARTP